jgi:hypothetical protein
LLIISSFLCFKREIGVWLCTKTFNLNRMPGNCKFAFLQLLINQSFIKWNEIIYYNVIGWYNDSWGYPSKSYGLGVGRSYRPLFTADDTIGCCLNFMNSPVFFTRNGVNLGNYYLFFIIVLRWVHKGLIQCFITYFKESCLRIKRCLYPCVGMRSRGGSVK